MDMIQTENMVNYLKKDSYCTETDIKTKQATEKNHDRTIVLERSVINYIWRRLNIPDSCHAEDSKFIYPAAGHVVNDK